MPEAREPVGSALAWAFPATYAIHLTEEYVLGFPAWFSRVFGAHLAPPAFLAINAVGLVLVVLAAGLVRAGVRPILPALGTLVLVNGSLHVVLSVLTGSYSPGAISGLLLWVPLGAFALRRAWACLSAGEFATGVAAGLALQAMAFLGAISSR